VFLTKIEFSFVYKNSPFWKTKRLLFVSKRIKNVDGDSLELFSFVSEWQISCDWFKSAYNNN
jgi:hypothetical protein